MTKTKDYAAMLYDMADELATEGRITERFAEPVQNAFVPNAFQKAILAALDKKGLRTDALAAKVGDRRRLFKDPGGLPELMEEGMVAHHKRIGYYRTDSPPQDLTQSQGE